MTEHSGQPSAFAAGIACKCPRCGEGRLFSGYLKVASRCESCGLDLKFAENGDGPAIIIIFIVGAIVGTAALLVDMAFRPPLLVHLSLWLPATLLLSLALLRPFKAIMIAFQYRAGLTGEEDGS
jgi:uncharacterized protein (DUF983 family)